MCIVFTECHHRRHEQALAQGAQLAGRPREPVRQQRPHAGGGGGARQQFPQAATDIRDKSAGLSVRTRTAAAAAAAPTRTSTVFIM